MAELRVTGKTKIAILVCKKFLKQLFLSKLSIATSQVCDFFFKSHPPRATTELFFTPSRDYRKFLGILEALLF